jgi:hypothetical protein
MNDEPKRPVRYRSLGKPVRVSVTTVVPLALCLTILAVWVVLSPAKDNIPGDVIFDVAFVSVAVWVDRLAIRRAREIDAIDAMFVLIAARVNRIVGRRQL